MKSLVKKTTLLILCFLFFFGGISHGASDVPALRDCKDSTERARIQSLINGARAEGKLAWWFNMIEPKMDKYIADGFKAYYGLPDLKFEFTYATNQATIANVEKLFQANRPTPDILWYAIWVWYKDLLARGKVMRYDSPMYKEYTVSHEVGNSMPGYWVSDSYCYNPVWNPAALAKAGIKDFNPTSWWDFADPKLSKLISLGNIPQSHSYALNALGWKKALGDDWFKKIGKNKPALYLKMAQGRDWVASGEYPITLTNSAKTAEAIKQTGVKVKMLYPKEGVVMLPFAPIILATAPHPNAAKLFIDYVRSAPGTNRVAESDVCLFYGRPGVKTTSEFLPGAENVKAIPMDWNSITDQSVTEIQQWVVSIGLCY